MCRLTLQHPASGVIAKLGGRIQLVVNCSVSAMTQAGLDTFRHTSHLQAVCVGKVLRWDEHQIGGTLVIRAIAVY